MGTSKSFFIPSVFVVLRSSLPRVGISGVYARSVVLACNSRNDEGFGHLERRAELKFVGSMCS